MSLATQDLFKVYMGLEPARSQSLQAITDIPWSIKLFYGLISDNAPICGSRRKAYIIIMGILQFTSMILLGLPSLKDAELATALIFLSNFGIAFSDVIVDALLVI